MIDFRLPGDDAIFRALNGLKVPWVDAVMVFATSKAFGLAMALFAGLWVLGSLRRHAVRAVVEAGLAVLITDRLGHAIIKPWIGRIRPCYALPKGTFRQLAEAGNQGSMPSLHAANAFTVAMAVTLCWPMAGKVLFPIAVLIAVSRVFVGVHWPSDVAAGAVFGSAVALGIHGVVGGLLRWRRGRGA